MPSLSPRVFVWKIQQDQMSIGSVARELLKGLSFRTGFLRDELFRRYPYMYTPQQLHFMTDCLRETREVRGCVVEAGCAYGATTIYLNRFMAVESIRRDYFAIDTFSGFVREHTDYEITTRGKRQAIRKMFAENSKRWFDRTMAIEGKATSTVRSIAADVARFDFSTIAPIAFCLLDVDLYLPIRDALPRIHEQMAPGGIIIVDDCAAGGDWDGALQAYTEHCQAARLPSEIRCGKLGILRAPVAIRPGASFRTSIVALG
jgi:SAM-dependent methyltransferase